jgi:Transglutaminase-like superfamily
MGRLLRFWSLPRREKHLLCEAAVLLLLSYLSVRTIAFRHIDSFLRARWNNGARDALDVAEVVKLTDVSLSRVVNLLPWKRPCLSRSMAAFIMLRRRGIPAVMVAGVKVSEDSSLHAHAWIDTGHAEPDVSSENSTFTTVVRIGQAPLIADSAPSPPG